MHDTKVIREPCADIRVRNRHLLTLKLKDGIKRIFNYHKKLIIANFFSDAEERV